MTDRFDSFLSEINFYQHLIAEHKLVIMTTTLTLKNDIWVNKLHSRLVLELLNNLKNFDLLAYFEIN